MLRGLYGMIQKRDTIQRKVPVKEMKKWISPAHFSWRKENR
jgi:hypothetical protein